MRQTVYRHVYVYMYVSIMTFTEIINCNSFNIDPGNFCRQTSRQKEISTIGVRERFIISSYPLRQTESDKFTWIGKIYEKSVLYVDFFSQRSVENTESTFVFLNVFASNRKLAPHRPGSPVKDDNETVQVLDSSRLNFPIFGQNLNVPTNRLFARSPEET